MNNKDQYPIEKIDPVFKSGVALGRIEAKREILKELKKLNRVNADWSRNMSMEDTEDADYYEDELGTCVLYSNLKTIIERLEKENEKTII